MLESDIEDIERQEREEKELRLSENQINRAQNKLENKDNDLIRPQRTWFQNKHERLQELGTHLSILIFNSTLDVAMLLLYLVHQVDKVSHILCSKLIFLGVSRVEV